MISVRLFLWGWVSPCLIWMLFWIFVILLITNIEEEKERLADTYFTIKDGKFYKEEEEVVIELNLLVKGWKKELKEELLLIESVTDVKAKINQEKLINDLGFGGMKNVQVIDISDKDIDMDNVLEKLGLDKDKNSSVSVINNKDSEYELKIYLNDEQGVEEVLKFLMNNQVQILKMEKK